MDSLCTMDEYETEERDAHINTIKGIILAYEKNSPITEDLMEDCRDLFLTYSANIFDNIAVKKNMQESRYLSRLYNETNVIVDFIKSLDKYSIELKYYYLFCKNLELMITQLNEPVDELSKLMSSITIKTNSRKLKH